MKVRGTRWVVATAAVVGFIVPIAACEDGTTTPGIKLGGVVVTVPEGGAPTDARIVPQDAAPALDAQPADAQPDAADAAIPAACDDGKVDPGESCDPLSSCPSSCPPLACQIRSLENGGTCSASCENVQLQTNCINGDGCCPPTCNGTNDDDCKPTCGNGLVEGTETCDPLEKCPTSCPQNSCQKQALVGAGTCEAKCVDTTLQTACSMTVSDKCCPPGCSVGTDVDCATGACGNGIVEPPELCDGNCPTTCKPDPANKCQLRKLQSPNTCAAVCVDDTLITACANNDGCCPASCNATNDNDCQPVCGNNVVEVPETCDPLGTCPTSCPSNQCQNFALKNPGSCQAACVASDITTTCKNGDGCCPPACNTTNDSDCSAMCGNGVVEPGELCDGRCPTCKPPQYACYQNLGDPKTCDAKCNVSNNTCGGARSDGCCPFAKGGDCDSVTDGDCAGKGWTFVKSATTISTNDCVSIVVDGIVKGSWYDFTTCSPLPAGTKPTAVGNSTISAVTDSVTGVAYDAINDDCSNPDALPILAGWSCSNTAGQQVMSCGTPSPGGFRAITSNPIKVTVCSVAAGGPALAAVIQPIPVALSAPFYVWFNAPSAPKP